jgi:hypothetical protein
VIRKSPRAFSFRSPSDTGTLTEVKECDLSNEAEGMAAQAEADAIIKDLGLDGEGTGNIADIVARIEAGAGDEFSGTMTDDDAVIDKGDKPQAESLTATDTTIKGEGEGRTAATGEEPAGVLLKDGKHFLPYEKHQELRRAHAEAENRAKALAEQLAALKAGKQTEDTQLGDGDDKGAASTGDLATDMKMVEELEAKAKAYEDEGLEELAANTATQAKVMRSLMTKVEKFGGYVEQAQARERAEQQRTQATAQEQAAEAVENNPTLRYLDETYDKDPKSKELWDRIAAEDKFLRTQPTWQDKSIADRFTAAIKRVELETGPIPLPTEYQTTTQVKAAAEARTREVGNEFRPNTLSDLPGGGLPRSANDDPFDSMDPVQLERLMEDPRKMNEILARVG